MIRWLIINWPFAWPGNDDAAQVVLFKAAIIYAVVVGAITRPFQDEIYGPLFFESLVPYERIEAARQWHSSATGREGWDCTFAIASLPPDAPEVPPSRSDRGPLGWQFAFGGGHRSDWQPTPMPPLGPSTRDAIGICESDWPEAAGIRIREALTKPGSWFWMDGVGEQIHVYSISQRIAARIRYGD